MSSSDSPPRGHRRAELGVGLLAATIAFNFGGLALGFFDHEDYDLAPFPVAPMSYVLNAGLVLWLPFALRSAWSRRVTGRLALVLAAWSLGGVVGSSAHGSLLRAVPPLIGVVLTVTCWQLVRAGATEDQPAEGATRGAR